MDVTLPQEVVGVGMVPRIGSIMWPHSCCVCVVDGTSCGSVWSTAEADPFRTYITVSKNIKHNLVWKSSIGRHLYRDLLGYHAREMSG